MKELKIVFDGIVPSVYVDGELQEAGVRMSSRPVAVDDTTVADDVEVRLRTRIFRPGGKDRVAVAMADAAKQVPTSLAEALGLKKGKTETLLN